MEVSIRRASERTMLSSSTQRPTRPKESKVLNPRSDALPLHKFDGLQLDL